MESGQDYSKELLVIDTCDIIADEDCKDMSELKFSIQDGFFKQELINPHGDVLRMLMFPVKYLHTVSTTKDMPHIEIPSKMHKMTIQEKRKGK